MSVIKLLNQKITDIKTTEIDDGYSILQPISWRTVVQKTFLKSHVR